MKLYKNEVMTMWRLARRLLCIFSLQFRPI